MAKYKQTRRAVSLRAMTYHLLTEKAKRLGIARAALLEYTIESGMNRAVDDLIRQAETAA